MIIITEYAAARVQIQDWKQKIGTDEQYNIWICGPTGTGKTQIMKEELAGIPHLYLTGGVTPSWLHNVCWRHLNEPIIFDGSIRKWASLMGGMLEDLTETKPVKTLQWNKIRNRNFDRDTPNSFYTKSPVIFVTDEIRGKPALSLVDRFTIVEFTPTLREMLKYMRSWIGADEFIDENIKSFDHAVGWLDTVSPLSCREWMKAKKGWEQARLSTRKQKERNNEVEAYKMASIRKQKERNDEVEAYKMEVKRAKCQTKHHRRISLYPFSLSI